LHRFLDAACFLPIRLFVVSLRYFKIKNCIPKLNTFLIEKREKNQKSLFFIFFKY